jgi:chromosome segregation ATPase
MNIAMPESVRRAWGEDVVVDFVTWFDEILHRRAVTPEQWSELESRTEQVDQHVAALTTEVKDLRNEMNDRFEQVDRRFDEVDRRFEQVDQRFEQVDQRFEQVDQRFEQLVARMDEQFQRLEDRFDRFHDLMHVQTRWAIGVMGLFGSMVTLLLAIGLVFGR